ncbi:hypothetical protein FRC01_013036 [Tulasnella sp. 417]|nr:hypothetical protein FRC01_013036 [Tulasnella sp. 417]
MRSLGLFWFTIVAVAAVIVGALPTKNDYPSINPDPSTIELKKIPRSSGSMKPKMTNAQRFSMNLPPLKPKLRRGTRVVSGRQSNTSPRPRTTQRCNILVTDADDGSIFGYIRPVWSIFGEYGLLQSTQAGALEVSFSYLQDDLSPAQLDITAVNGPSSVYPLFGASMGPFPDGASLNLGPGSFNHAFIDSTTQIPAGSTPQAGDNNSFTAVTGAPSPAESAIWMYDPVTQEITAQWVNPDGSTPPTYIIYYSVDRAL